MTIDREYRPLDVERRWSAEWAERALFEARPASGRPPFCMVIPPPNITGHLHVGHVLVYTLHDIIARWRRMRGDDVLWLPGTDHAGIATQMVVERELHAAGHTREDLGRAEFERRVWDWKERYGGSIVRSLRELGASVDWTRERFTLDDGLSRAVRTVFVRLHREGLVYRDRYIVNWCPRCRTALSDLETESRPVRGRLYTIRYPGADGSPGVLVATTRPETLLGDTGVAVHPGDPRFAGLVGREVRVPLTGRTVTVWADAFVDPEFGTGAVKITPAHDPTDFEAGRRLGLAELEVIGADARMTDAALAYRGLERETARTRVVEDLRREGLLLEERPHEHAVGHCQRCGTIVEPRVSVQWFVRMAPLAEAAIHAVAEERVRFVPALWSKTYFEWMRNIHDWCISRQLWWGHRIPAWYCASCGSTLVEVEAPPSCAACGSAELRQDEDVLDTWFSSALWPFSTLGWPDDTPDLRRYYPTRLLITGHDIIFFWVARMIVMGLKFMGQVPFREVYIHGLVRDAEGQKMSKSKGNTVDPEVLHQRYGTDAVRLTMAMLAAPGNDIPLAPERMEGYRAFANKLWNASRFALLKLDGLSAVPPRPAGPTLADRYVLSRLARTTGEVDRALGEYRFDRAADLLYHFVWHEFCDWYIELLKPDLPPWAAGSVEPAPRARDAQAVLLEVLDSVLRLLHPFMPFITEELWHRLPGARDSIALAAWPAAREADVDVEAEAAMALFKTLVQELRNLRAESGIDPGRPVPVLVAADDPATERLLAEHGRLLAPLVRAAEFRVVPHLPADLVAARGVAGDLELAIPQAGLFDASSARARLVRELERLEREFAGRARKLENSAFLERAPAEVVAEERERQRELTERRRRLERNLTGLGGAAPS